MRPDDRQQKHPCRSLVLSWITDVNKKVNLCDLAVILYISCPLKILKETVVFYYALCNLLAFKDDFPLFFLVPLTVPLALPSGGLATMEGDPHSRVEK